MANLNDNTEVLLTIKLNQELFVNPKRIQLLKEIQKCGSINQSAKNIQVSYKSAWDHLAAMNEISPQPLLERSIGGKHGGGTSLTTYALRLLQLYDLLEQTQKKAFDILQDESVPLDSVLSATAKFAPQSSARNQFFGKVHQLLLKDAGCLVDIKIETLETPITVSITAKSAVRLGLELDKEVMLMIKAPWVKIFEHQPHFSHNLFLAQAVSVQRQGESCEVNLKLGELECCATIIGNSNIEVGQNYWVHIEPEQIILLAL